MATTVSGTCVDGLPGPKHNGACKKGKVICCRSVPELVSITCTAPSLAPTNSKSPAGLKDALKGVAVPAREICEVVCAVMLNTITNAKRAGLGGGWVSPRM